MKYAYFLLLLAFCSKPKVNLENGLMAHYPMNGNANDIIVNPANGSVIGATLTSDRDGNADNAYHFSNTGDMISVPVSNKLDFSSSDFYTFSAWVRSDQTTARHQQILNIYKIGGLEIMIPGTNDQANSNKLMVSNYDGINGVSVYEQYSDITMQKNIWYHIAVTIDNSSNEMNAYINGKLHLSLSTSTFVFDKAGLTIGNHASNSWDFKGSIDDVRIYKRKLNQAEISALATYN